MQLLVGRRWCRAKDGIWGIWGNTWYLQMSHKINDITLCPPCVVHTEHAVSLYILHCCENYVHSHTIAPCADKYVCIFYGNIWCYVALHYVEEIIFYKKKRNTLMHITRTLLPFQHRHYASFPDTRIEFIGKGDIKWNNIKLCIQKCLLYTA